ncbi:MAG: N-acetyltransferase [Acidobacteria bacterium]|nr:N-acetyltransferase [Acidobacteriota bacterium]MBI3663151.1 N-acetyltransferase [Acidobacteriota bacterium]
MIFADLGLAQRLEGVDAAGGAASATAEAQLRPLSGATSLTIAGGQAMFVGVGSPITQAFALGLHGPMSDMEMDALEDFFRSRGSGVFIEVCPLADVTLTEHLNRRGYRAIEFSNVLVRQLPARNADSPSSAVAVRRAGSTEAELWSRVVAEGFLGPDYPPEMLELFHGLFRTETGTAYLAWLDGKAVGGGGMMVHEGVVNLFGDGTIAAHRGRGVQAALIAARLEAAAALGCDLAMASTQCGSTSQRNYERQGFRVAYTRTKWQREWA